MTIAIALALWAGFCVWMGQRTEVPADFQHPSEISPDGCYDEDYE